MRKKLFRIFTGALLIFSVVSAMASAGSVCPVMPDHQGSSKYAVDYKGKTYNFCCKSCVKKFNKNPEKYSRTTAGAA